MSKKRLLISAIVFSSIVILLINLYYPKAITKSNSAKMRVFRNVVDSFIPVPKSLVFKLSKGMLRTSCTNDTVRILTQDFNILTLYDSKKISYEPFKHAGEFWYFNVSKGDTIVFDKNANNLISGKFSFRFEEPVNAVELINDSIFFIEKTGKKTSYLQEINIKSKKSQANIDLFNELHITDENSKKVPNLATCGVFAQNEKNIYYAFWRAGYIIKISKIDNKYQTFRTIDSSETPAFVNKKFTMNAKSISYLTYEQENWINLGMGCTNKYVVILSEVPVENNCVYLDFYSADDFKYIKSIKILNSYTRSTFNNNNSSAYEIKCTTKDVYFIYENDEVYVKKNCL